ncbi:hypothetical protein Dda_4381 [Drechslerella dactyloides]|uniref:Cytochrome c oxidase assembly factor 3 n=1 Tax=Drechslerella dactyloides TaxID=74499 RepID=A0AAD6IWX4_DREDA|nr:hypothetical protein Dda_4381 [Drechslerella dactyloides]
MHLSQRLGMPILSDRIKRSSYYNPDYRQGQSLIRARSPYLVKNAITGLALVGFVIGIYAYTIRAIKSDDFADAALPPKNKDILKDTLRTKGSS